VADHGKAVLHLIFFDSRPTAVTRWRSTLVRLTKLSVEGPLWACRGLTRMLRAVDTPVLQFRRITRAVWRHARYATTLVYLR
jgi:hypothetical protein